MLFRPVFRPLVVAVGAWSGRERPVMRRVCPKGRYGSGARIQKAVTGRQGRAQTTYPLQGDMDGIGVNTNDLFKLPILFRK